MTLPALDKLLQQHDALPAQGADSLAISQLLESFKQQHHLALPPLYLDLLRWHDGLWCNGIRLYGTHPMPLDANHTYFQNSLLDANENFKTRFPNLAAIMLGETETDVLIYDLSDHRFKIADDFNGDELYRFETAFDMLRHLLEELPATKE